MTRYAQTFPLTLALMLLASAPLFAEDHSRLDQLRPDQHYLVTEPLSLQKSRSQAGNFNAKVIFLADQLERNIDKKFAGTTYIVATFSNLDKLNETTSFGRLIAENLIHELQVRKWQVFDVRLTKDIIINDTGEFTLSRDILKIRDTYKVNAVVTGTYAVHSGGITVNARVIDLDTGIVSASAQTHLPLDWYAEELIYSSESRSVVKVVGDE